MKKDIYKTLNDWHELLNQGIITEEEFSTKKEELLGNVKNISKTKEAVSESVNEPNKINFDPTPHPSLASTVSKNVIFIILGAIIIGAFAFYYYENIKEPNKELDFNEIENSSNKTEIENLQELAYKHFDKYKSRLETENTIINDTDTTYVGDFTNDGLLDVVLVYGLDPKEGNYNVIGGILLYKNNDKGITFIKKYSPEYIYNFDKILNSKIYLTKLEYSENDGRCCPSINKKMELKLEGENIIEKEIK
ncbi:SHOCT domain-containing protein [Flavobacterium taihuense]|uniref:SHOCT domain-containing protein n=1 Tax=Flavobacterium taihuense TaxID=2857508 RepID=A0ABS6Y1C6_9FLAO|nr:SHOCT domain-containing protein [Flavobacterium taihuense]MBW4362721.1 SHOCT domain-containing protein [Flavobacterium taihuense]